MNIMILLSIASLIALVIIILKIKTPQNKKIITAKTTKSQSTLASIRDEVSLKIREFKEIARSSGIRPENSQQRNLDREVGGLEEGKTGSEKENKELHEAHIKDIWDDRSEEVDKMGSHIPLGSTAKKSMIWRLKKAKLDGKETIKKTADALEAHSANKDGKVFDSSKQQGGFKQMIKAREDHGHGMGGNDRGAWR